MSRKHHILPLAFIALIALAFFYPVLDGSLLLSERDLSVFFIPPRFLWVKEVMDGVFPLWNPYSYSGQPLFALLQPGVLYPLNVLLLVMPFDIAFNWTIVLHFILAGVFTYLLLTELGAGRGGALISAITFMLSGYLFSVHNVISTLFTSAWVPFALLLYMRALKRGAFSYSILAGIVLVFMFMAGGIEVLFATFVFFLILSLAPGAFPGFHGRPLVEIRRRLLLFFVSSGVFLSLSAVQLLPFLELAGQSIRAGGLPYHEATTWSLDFKDFVQFFIPDPYGYFISDEKYWANQSWLKSVYLGAVPFILSSFFFIEGGRRLLPFLLTGLLFLSLSMGRNNAFYPLLYDWAPFFDKIRYPVKFIFLPFLFVSVSAGLGYESLKKGLSLKRKRLERPLVSLLAVSTFAALLLAFLSFFEGTAAGFLIKRGIDYPEYNRVGVNIFNAKRLLVFLILVSTALYSSIRSSSARKALPYIVIAVLSFDLFFAHSNYYGTTNSALYHSRGWALDFLKKREDGTLFRVFVTPKTKTMEPEAPLQTLKERPFDVDKERVSGYNLLHGVFDASGVEVMRLSGYETLYNIMATQPAPDSTNIPALLNVKYVVSIPMIKSPEFTLRAVLGADERTDKRRLKELEGKNTLKVYENLNFLPRFFLVQGYTVVKNGEEYVRLLSSKAFDPGSTVILEKSPWEEGDGGAGGNVGVGDSKVKKENSGIRKGPRSTVKAPEDGSVEVLEYNYDRIRLRVRSNERTLLVASESYYPGWKAYVNGEEREVLKADYVLRAVAVGKGEQQVEFSYEPMTFRIGLYTSALGAAGLVIYGAAAALKRRKRAG